MYQIELVSKSVNAELVPSVASASAQEGFVAFKTYCLSCYHLQGVGGSIVQADIKQLVTGKTRNELRSWVDNHRKVSPGTNMPRLNENLEDKERARVIDQIVDFLELL